MISQVDNRPQKIKKIKKTTRFARLANPFLNAFGRAPAVAITRRVPNGTRVYCVGDIHGRDDLLRELAERVEADIMSWSFDHAVTVFLGDYVDRGRHSMRVLEQLASAKWPTSDLLVLSACEEMLFPFSFGIA